MHAHSVLSGRQTSAQQLHAQMNMNTIIHHLLQTRQYPEEYLESLRPNICGLTSFYLHIHLSFCMFISECMQTCMCQSVHVLCKSCLLRWWIKQQVHLICKALQGKYTQNDTRTQTQIHIQRLAYSIKIISVTESILRSSSKPFFPWYKSLLFMRTATHTNIHMHTWLKATLPGGHTAFT